MRILLAVIATIAAVTSAANADVAVGQRGVQVAQSSVAEPSPSVPLSRPAAPVAKPATPVRPGGTVDRGEQPDCVWTGKRLVQVLVRDDLIAADGFFKFYNAFGCPVAHLGAAFSCTVDGLEQADPKTLDARIDACWADPTATPRAAESAMADESKPVPKSAEPDPKPGSGTAYPKR